MSTARPPGEPARFTGAFYAVEEVHPKKPAYLMYGDYSIGREPADALTEVVGAEPVYAFVLGHDVRHFHEDVVPRHMGAQQEYWGIQVAEWPDAPRGGVPDIGVGSEGTRRSL